MGGAGGQQSCEEEPRPLIKPSPKIQIQKTVFEVTEAGGGKVTDERKLDDIRRVR
jgi:hypothetical protein